MSVTDLHITHTITNGIKYYSDNESAFNDLFFDISDTLKATYHAKLSALDIKYDVALRKRQDKFPLITVSINEKSQDTFQPLGNRGFQEQLTLLVNQECEINVYVEDIDALRVLSRILQASMLIFKKNFLALGYLNIQFDKSTSLSIEEEVVTSSVEVYGRSFKFLAQRQINAKPPVTPFDLPWELNSTIIQN